MKSLIGHCLNPSGCIEFEVEYVDGETAFHLFSVAKVDYPKACADYIIANKFTLGNARMDRWARLFLQNLQRTV